MMSLSRKLAAPLALSFALVAGQAMANDNTQAFTCDAPDMSGWSLPDRMEKIMPATVKITTMMPKQAVPQLPPGMKFPPGMAPQGGPDGKGAPKEYQPEGIGSGFIVDPSGIIFTNHHVVDGGVKFEVTFYDPKKPNNLGKTVEAKLLGSDKPMDLAALKVELPGDLPCVSFGDSDKLRLGDTINIVGNPLGVASFSLSKGIISNTMRNIGNPFYDMFQTDAAINHGNSGGPVFDEKGHLIGVSDAMLSRSNGNIGIGLLLKSNDVAEVGGELVKYGEAKRAGLGVQIQDVLASTAISMGVEEGKGVLITRVVPNRPAALSGIKENDIILEFGGTEVNSSAELVRAISKHNPGDDVEVKLLRDGAQMTLDVNLTDRSAAVAGLSEPPAQKPETAPRAPAPAP